MQDTALILSGLIIGAIIGLTGVGGGSLMTPLLIMGFGVNPAIAVGTDLLFAAATKLGGTVRLARERLIAWRAVGLLSVGSLPAALLTMAVLQHLGPSSAETEQLIRQVLGVALLLTALATLHNVLASQRKKNAVLANNGHRGSRGSRFSRYSECDARTLGASRSVWRAHRLGGHAHLRRCWCHWGYRVTHLISTVGDPTHHCRRPRLRGPVDVVRWLGARQPRSG